LSDTNTRLQLNDKVMKYLDIEFTRVNNDSNGNPRYVFHFLSLLSEEESQETDDTSIEDKFRLAHQRALKIGASKYRGKDFGGGFVVQSYNLHHTAKSIVESRNK